MATPKKPSDITPALPWVVPGVAADKVPTVGPGMRRRVKGFLPGGQFKTLVANFSGGTNVGAGGFGLYGVDGVNPAWVYDGNTVQFIETGVGASGLADVPVALEVLPTQQLALGYAAGSLMLSAYGDPVNFNVGKGAAEIAVSDEILDLAVQPSGYLAIFCRSTVKILMGTMADNFQLSTYSKKLSLTPKTLQPLGDSIFLSDDGVKRLARVQEFGDFKDLPLSAAVKPLLDKLERRAQQSWIVATRNEYWLQFEQGLGVIIKFTAAEVAGISTFKLPTLFSATVSAEGTNREEVVFAGDCENGYVYQLERGDSFDGVEIEAVYNGSYNFMGSVEHRKRFKKMQLDIKTPEKVSLKLRAELDYASTEAPPGFTHDVELKGGGGFYDLDLFEHILWSEAQFGLTDTYVQGVGRNASVAVYTKSDKEPPHVLDSLIIHWAPRGRRV